MELADTPGGAGKFIVEHSPLWYCMMCMKAFCEGNVERANILYDMGQEVLRETGSELKAIAPPDSGEIIMNYEL